MIAIAIYFVLTLLGIAVGLEMAFRKGPDGMGLPAAIWAIATILFAMFIGGWSTSRLAVGETRGEAFLYGIILWGVMFVGMTWMIGQGVKVGFGSILGVASGAVILDDDSPVTSLDSVVHDPEAIAATRQAVWYTLIGVLVSMASVIIGSLAGSGELVVPVPLAGVRKAPTASPKT